MPIDQKALKVEIVAEVVTKIKIAAQLLNEITPLLDDKLDIDEDIMYDFSLAKQRVDYITDHVRRMQLKLRKT